MLDQEYELVDVDRLEPHPDNPRRGNVPAITESVRSNGFFGAVVAQRSTGYVLAGNHRLLAAREHGLDEVPVIWVDVDDDRARRILLVDNRASDRAGYDDATLAAILEDLAGSDAGLDGTGFSDADLAEMLANQHRGPTSLTDPDAAPPIPPRPKSTAGDLWLLGPHRVVCGDSTDVSVVRRALDGALADMVFTDPPYGVAYEGGTADKLTIANDALSAEALEAFLTSAFAGMREVLRPGGAFYVCGPAGNLELTFRLALRTSGLELRQQIVWAKDRFVLGRSDYHYQHETILYGWQLDGEPLVPPHYDPEHDTILYGWRDGAAHSFEGGRKQSTLWQYDKPARSSEHPTMKPVDLVRRAVLNSTRPGGRVLDVFGGSGSTMIAAHLTGRVASLVELDPRYVDVICRRYQEHTGIVPILEATGDEHDFTGGA